MAAPTPAGPTANLGAPTGPTVSFGFNMAKVADHGEDSDPILRDGPDLGLAGVFDGMGGAGGTVYDTPEGARSGAYLASRIARDVVEQHLLAALLPDRPLPGPRIARELHDALESALQGELAGLNAPASRLRSRLLRALPTTMALGALQRAGTDGTGWVCHVLWAGDSRVFSLDVTGLHQLSVDDLRDPGDALANLQRDSVISNAISADTEFVINHRRVALTTPFVLLCATDGCFGYLRSPMHFEHLVLATLAGATSEEQWSAALQAGIGAVTGDDAAMAVIVVGADLTTLQALLAPRLTEVTEQYTAPMDDLDDQVAAAERSLAELHLRRGADVVDRWQRYRHGYEQLLHEDTETHEEPVEEIPAPRIWNPAKPISTGALTSVSGEAAGRPAGDAATADAEGSR